MTDLVLFANDPKILADFYVTVFAMDAQYSSDEFVLLCNVSTTLLVHQIPEQYVEEIRTPPILRDDCAWKPILEVPSINRAREVARALGGGVLSPDHEWTMNGHTYCDGFDPEGNVIQLKATT